MNRFLSSNVYRLKLCILFMLLCLLSCKKEFKAAPGAQTFQYEPYGLTNIEDYMESSSSAQYFLGSKMGLPVLIKTDASGSILWQRQWEWLHGALRIIENKDHSLLIVGNDFIDTGLSIGYNLKIAKISSEGQLLNRISYLFSKRDTATVVNDETLEYHESYTSDGKGGYFFPVLYNYGKWYILHYNSDDQIDESVYLTAPSNIYNALSVLYLEAELSPTGGLLLAYYNSSTTNYSLEELDTTEYFQGKIKSLWRTVPLITNFYLSFNNNVVADDKFIYHSTIIRTADNKKTVGVKFLKADKSTGKIIHDWLIPLEESLRASFPTLADKMLIDGNNLYCLMSVANNLYIVKSNTEGTDFWTKQLGGKISDENLGILRLVGKELNVFAFNTNNRSLENILFMCRLNGDGQILLK